MNINDFYVEITRKNVKNVNLKVYPNLKIKVSVPQNMDITSVKKMIISKEKWIKSRLKKYEEQIRMTKRNYVSGEDHYLNGKRYILKVIDSKTPSVKKENGKTLIMKVRKSSSIQNKEKLMNSFYKKELAQKIDKYMGEIETTIGVKSSGYYIRKMKNKWGSCNYDKKTIIFNTELAKKKDVEIKYVIIHELIHLLEKKHNENFKKLVKLYCPKWEEYHNSLNRILNNNKV